MKAKFQPEGEVDDKPRFGDLDWIHARGLPRRRIRDNKGAKTRAQYIKPDPPKSRRRKPKPYQPIWQRIEGEWTRYYCRDCNAVSFRVIEQRDPWVYVQCAAGHVSIVMTGFKMERPE